MALASLRQVLDHAAEYGYASPAFNVNNMGQIHAIMQAMRSSFTSVLMDDSPGEDSKTPSSYA